MVRKVRVPAVRALVPLLAGAVVAGRLPLGAWWGAGVLLAGLAAALLGTFSRKAVGRVAVGVGLLLSMWGWAGIGADQSSSQPVGGWVSAVRQGEAGDKVIWGRAVSVRWSDDWGGLQRLVTLDSLWAGDSPVRGQLQLALGREAQAVGLGDRAGVTVYPARKPSRVRSTSHNPQYAKVAVFSATQLQVIPTWNPVWVIRRAADKWLKAGFGSDDESGLLAASLILGENDPRLADLRQAFVATGTAHQLAISGEHLAVIGAMIGLISRLAAVRPRWQIFSVMMVLVVYGVAVVPSSPVTRAVLAAVLFAAGRLLQRPGAAGAGVNLLAVVAILLLTWDPTVWADLGCQTTMVVTAAIIVGSVWFRSWIEGARDPDFRVVDSWRPATFGARRRLWCRRLALWLGVTVIAWGVSAPIIACRIQGVSLLAVPSGVLLMWPVSLAIITGFAKILLTAVLPWCAGWFAWGMSGLMLLVAWLVRFLAHVPGMWVWAERMPVWLGAVLLVLMCGGAVLWGLKRRRVPPEKELNRGWLWSEVAGPTLAIVLMLCWPVWSRAHEAPLVIAIRGGDGAVIQLPDRSVWIVAGRDDPSPMGTPKGWTAVWREENLAIPTQVVVGPGQTSAARKRTKRSWGDKARIVEIPDEGLTAWAGQGLAVDLLAGDKMTAIRVTSAADSQEIRLGKISGGNAGVGWTVFRAVRVGGQWVFERDWVDAR